jgi:hypothetical protein
MQEYKLLQGMNTDKTRMLRFDAISTLIRMSTMKATDAYKNNYCKGFQQTLEDKSPSAMNNRKMKDPRFDSVSTLIRMSTMKATYTHKNNYCTGFQH